MNSPTNSEVVAARGPRNHVDPSRPYGWTQELEPGPLGVPEATTTVFITNSECPFKCTMCDLWKNTTKSAVPAGSITHQIRSTLEGLPWTPTVKLYNAGSFFDRRAISPLEFAEIAELVRDRREVVVECHPKLVGSSALEFSRLISPARLQIAMGLETVDVEGLAFLNKGMTLKDFESASLYLTSNGIGLRSFVMLRPPGQSECQGIDWALKSVEFAAKLHSDLVAVIPTRPGNGMMELLASSGEYHPPRLRSLERVLERSLERGGVRVVADLWDIEQFATCPSCVEARIERLARMNETQVIPPVVDCTRCGPL